jgi:hypothetical protein
LYVEAKKSPAMDQKPATNPPKMNDPILAQAVAKAQIAVATCVGIHRAMVAPETPQEPSPWHPSESRQEHQEFEAALDRWLERREAQQRSAA